MAAGGGGGGGEGAEKMPLLRNILEYSEESGVVGIKRTGTLWTAIAHIITAVIGSGVLSLAWSMAQLGWVAGPIAMISFAAVTLLQSTLLADCYRSPDPDHGHIRNHSYIDAVKVTLGGKSVWFCVFFQLVNLYGLGVAYTITSSISMRGIKGSGCYQSEGHHAPCLYEDTFFMLMFGAAQIILSQIPNFHKLEWLSIMAAAMSFCYSTIGFALGLSKVIENGRIFGDIRGVPMESTAEKVWRVSQALGDIAFAYPYSIVLLVIEDTLKSPPQENQTMKRASMIASFITTVFYLCCGCFGYAAFGNDTPGNLLTGFSFLKPHWLIDVANACVVLHLVGAYQMFSQIVFSYADRWFADNYPNSAVAIDSYTIRVPFLQPHRLNLLRLCFRTLYVISTTGIAMIFPYFNQVLGVLGSFNFWAITIYFPVEMYFVQRKVGVWTRTWVIFKAYSFLCLLVSSFAFVGSVEGLFSEKLR